MKKIILYLILISLNIPCWAEDIEFITVHPIFDEYYSCAEHWAGQFSGLGDALGTDCFIEKLEERNGRFWLRPYKEEGFLNEDWYSWHKNVLSPINGEVIRINENTTINTPGILGKGIASYIILKRSDNVMVLLAHVSDFTVKAGDIVKEGQIIAKVGNNGQSRHPHIHIGAWKNKAPLQIRFDQKNIKGL